MPETFANVARHIFGFLQSVRFIDKLLSELRRIVRRETHQIFLDPEKA